MAPIHYNILLADDDLDDCHFFKEALEELSFAFSLTIVNNGEQLMNFLNLQPDPFPDILFLDLNMPRISGFECLSEIKQSENLKQIPVIIYSTSLDRKVVELLSASGAHRYARKPNSFSKISKIIEEAIESLGVNNLGTSAKDYFVIQG